MSMSSPTSRAADNKREEFRRYLERHGVMDQLTRALHALYEEPDKPDDPVRYVCNQLSHSFEEHPSIDALQSELEETRFEVQRLRDEITNLRPSTIEPAFDESAVSPPVVTTSSATMTTTTESVSADGMRASGADANCP